MSHILKVVETFYDFKLDVQAYQVEVKCSKCSNIRLTGFKIPLGDLPKDRLLRQKVVVRVLKYGIPKYCEACITQTIDSLSKEVGNLSLPNFLESVSSQVRYNKNEEQDDKILNTDTSGLKKRLSKFNKVQKELIIKKLTEGNE